MQNTCQSKTYFNLIGLALFFEYFLVAYLITAIVRMNNKSKAALYFLSGASIVALAFVAQSFKEPNKNESTVEVKEDGKLQYKWYQPDVPKNLTFAGERVPLE